jgi:hypothetical protein
MFARFIGIAAAKQSKKRWDPTEEPEELRILQKHATIYTFSTYPWALWIIGVITLLIAFYLTFFLFYICNKQE